MVLPILKYQKLQAAPFFNLNTMKKATIITILAAICCLNASAQKNDPDLQSIRPELFKNPPADFRGIRWQGFPLSNLTDSGVVRSLQNA